MHIERYRNRHPVYFRPFFGRGGFGDVDRFFTGFFDGEGKDDVVAFNPAVDLVDHKDSLQVRVELPGVVKDDVEISIKDDLLTIKGEKRTEEKKEGENRYYVERSYGSFARTLTLPDHVKTDEIKASFKNGVLEITIPKDEEAREKEIKVEVN